MANSAKVEEVIVQIVIRVENEKGEKVNEQLTQPQKFFRASQPDIWAAIDAELAKAVPTAPKE